MADWKVERLGGNHDRSGFRCGKPELDEFLEKYVSQYERRGLARAFVAVLPPAVQVLGYYTLSAGSISLEALPERERRKLPRHPVPVAHLGRLAVAQVAQGKGLGEYLLMDALARCARSSDAVAVYAVAALVIDDTARRFYLQYGFATLEDDPLHLYLSLKKITALNLEAPD
jgi:GNAT superfamily N-acetyltransferase